MELYHKSLQNEKSQNSTCSDIYESLNDPYSQTAKTPTQNYSRYILESNKDYQTNVHLEAAIQSFHHVFILTKTQETKNVSINIDDLDEVEKEDKNEFKEKQHKQVVIPGKKGYREESLLSLTYLYLCSQRYSNCIAHGEQLLKENPVEQIKFKVQMYLVEAYLTNMDIKAANLVMQGVNLSNLVSEKCRNVKNDLKCQFLDDING